MLLLVVRETNRRAKLVTQQWNQSNPDNLHVWSETDEIEMSALFGLLMLIGVHKSGGESLNELWSTSDGAAVFRATMSERRFQDLLRFCRFDNNATRQLRQAEDKLAPIRDFWEMFQETLKSPLKPGSDLTIDEQLITTRGRCQFKQYIPSKPGKYGIKVF